MEITVDLGYTYEVVNWAPGLLQGDDRGLLTEAEAACERDYGAVMGHGQVI